MKTKMKRQRQTELPRFVFGALATAGASVASGATVQITFQGNYRVSNIGLGSRVDDFTGDGTADALAGYSPSTANVGTYGGRNLGFAGKGDGLFSARVGDLFSNGAGDVTYRNVVSFSFRDPSINSDAWTSGWLDMTSSSTSEGQEIWIHRLIFDDENVALLTDVTSEDEAYTEWERVSAVPEASSSLALLALGAGGLTLRRRLKRAA